MSERFYTNLPLNPGPATLEGAEAHHLAQVCRLRAGDLVCLFNGDGHEYPARIEQIERRAVYLEIIERLSPVRELQCTLEVASPLPKGDRAQFLIEKLTELGVARYVVLETQRSVVHPREGKLEKLQRYAIEASKQSGRNVIMEVVAPMNWEKYCREPGLPAERFFGRIGGAGVPRIGGTASRIGWAVGPEGGFTEDEEQMAIAAGWRGVSLGMSILRMETAAIAGAVVFGIGRGAVEGEA